MPKKGANISLSSYDDIFSTEESRADQAAEKVQEIPLSELHPFKDHPFKVLDDESMERTVESIRRYGVMVPAIARPSPEGGYEMISGHRRHHASELAGKETMPVIVREMDDDAATILMVDSNLQREELLPSERAFAYRMKNEAMKRLSYLKPEEQKDFMEAMDYAQATPSLSQAQRIKKYSQEGKCSLDVMCAVMDEVKKDDMSKVTISHEVLRKYFPKSYTPKQMEDTIIRLLEQWQRRKQREQAR